MVYGTAESLVIEGFPLIDIVLFHIPFEYMEQKWNRI